MENTLVWCKTKAQVVAVLTEAKKRGYNIDSPTEMGNMFWANHHEETVVNLNGNGRSITYCYKDWYINHPSYGNIIIADKFFASKPILITRKGRVVTAENKNTGEKAIATCCPTDTFDFGTGAMIAVARLIAQSDKGITKDAETVLRQLLGYDAETPADAPTEEVPKPFKVGSLVTLRPDVTPGIEYNGLMLKPGEMYDTAFRKPIKVFRYDSGDQTYLCKAEGAERSWWYDSNMLKAWDESKPEMPTTKFKVGDLVTLKDDLEVGKSYGAVDLLEVMYSNGHNKQMKVVDTIKCEDGDMAYDCTPISGGRSYWYVEETLELWDEGKIREGDKVHVKKGCTKDRYDTYYKWLKDYISDVDLLLGFERSDAISTTDTYTVVKIAPHGFFGGTQLAFIKRTNGIGDTFSYLYDIDSLEKVTEE